MQRRAFKFDQSITSPASPSSCSHPFIHPFIDFFHSWPDRQPSHRPHRCPGMPKPLQIWVFQQQPWSVGGESVRRACQWKKTEVTDFLKDRRHPKTESKVPETMGWFVFGKMDRKKDFPAVQKVESKKGGIWSRLDEGLGGKKRRSLTWIHVWWRDGWINVRMDGWMVERIDEWLNDDRLRSAGGEISSLFKSGQGGSDEWVSGLDVEWHFLFFFIIFSLLSFRPRQRIFASPSFSQGRRWCHRHPSSWHFSLSNVSWRS